MCVDVDVNEEASGVVITDESCRVQLQSQSTESRWGGVVDLQDWNCCVVLRCNGLYSEEHLR